MGKKEKQQVQKHKRKPPLSALQQCEGNEREGEGKYKPIMLKYKNY